MLVAAVERTTSIASERWQGLLLAGVMLAVGALAWSFQLREPLQVDPQRLGDLPWHIDAWSAVDVPLDSTVESILRADYNVQRVYQHPVGPAIALYVGYYGTDRGGRPEHTPWVCYPNAGWSIIARRTVSVDPERGLRVNEIEVDNEGNRQLVHFWYRSFRSTGLLGAVDQVRDRLVSRLRHDRSDGALVRVSTSLSEGDLVGARSRLMAFGAHLDRLLDDHWPEEHPASRGSARSRDSARSHGAARAASRLPLDSR